LLVQKNEPKKKTPLPFGPSDFFALLKAAGNFQTRFAQTVKIPFSAAFPVLNKWQWVDRHRREL
jgi:hypothetical protein